MEGPRVPESERPARRGRWLAPLVIVVAVAVITAILLAWYVTRPPPLVTPPATNPLDFTLPEATSSPPGQAWHLQDHLAGKPILLEFMQPECPHCPAMVPVLREFQNGTYGPRVLIVSVVVHIVDPPPTLAGALSFAVSTGSNWTYVVEADGAHAVRDAYNVTGVPSLVLLALDGSVAWTHLGSTDVASIEAAVQRII